MKIARHIKLIMLNVLVVGGLLGVGMPMPAHAAQGSSEGESIAISSHAASDELVDEGSTDEEATASSHSKPEYKYVPVRRY